MLRRLRRKKEPPAIPAAAITMDAIGVVANRIEKPMMRGWERVESIIYLRAELGGSLEGLIGHSHVIVIFWMDQVPEPARRRVRHHLHGDEKMPIKGDLATRTQNRPNPIGLSAVRLKAISDRSLTVVGLDATNGTPVLDIKPYIPDYDSIADARAPGWVYGKFDGE